MKPKASMASHSDQLDKEARARKNCFRIWTIIGSIILLLGLGYVLNILSIPVGIIIWTTILVFILRSPVNWLEKRGINRAAGTALAYVAMVVVIGGIGLLMFSPAFGIGEQFTNLIESVPGYISQISDWYFDITGQYAGFLENETVSTWINDAGAAFGSWASDIAKNSADGLVAVGSTVINSFMVIGFALVVAFWILMDLPAIGRECTRLIEGRHREDAQMMYVTSTRVMGGYIKATLVQCVLIGVGCGIAFQILGLPNAAALGGITGLLNIIPVVGPWLGGALAAIVGVFISPWVAIIALALTIIIQQVIYTFVSPKLMADSVDIHPALVILGLLAGSAIGGAMNGFMGSLVGMLASIPAVAAGKAIFVYYYEKRINRSIVSEDGVFFKGTPNPRYEGSYDPFTDAIAFVHQEESEQARKKTVSSQPDDKEGAPDKAEKDKVAEQNSAASKDTEKDRH